MKKRGFGVGKWNGIGGKCEPGESIEKTLIREAKEEIGVRPISYKKAAEIRFFFSEKEKSDQNQKVHVFLADKWEGVIIESEEMKPKWIDMDKLPLEDMLDGNKYWLEEILSGKNLEASFLFDKDEKIIDYKMKEVNYLTDTKKSLSV